ncbi:two-component system LytT family sensor kinase [Agromyces flavus]|uniref:Two-component system LytT family sensor kinase n=1 Tax=Agromyces flavus TaxID=589382 RepID=A0A1H1WDS0_9MICO|nr:histidine kinase [Agromyces flavus]MCP2366154.1 two-component system LytT family sensor kinase [Agromyces flavus]GGI44108.1 signal transduction histidine kinase [Agromyces flavus]SDS95437.1 two-component system, LytT family, sensor kinase [Agromyces flavus]
MIDAVWLPVAALAGVAFTLLAQWVWRMARGARDLGSDAERAAFRTLSLASRAAVHLRGGLGAGDVPRAARTLRALLGSEAIAISDREGIVSIDGRLDLGPAAWQVAESVLQTGQRQLLRGSPDAVGAPIVADGRTVGVIVAFAAKVRAPLVRATTEVATWCGAQIELGGLEASRTALAEAELRALRAQISPHFVYNALSVIASYISTDPERARDLLLDFADFIRYSFRRQGEFTTLADELQSVHSYVELERARFEDRLSVTLRIEPETLATVIPFLSLQPLVENAIRHGLEPRERGGTVVISSHDDGTHTEITVDDDGVGMDPAALRELFAERSPADRVAHIGLRNVDSRVRGIYGDDHALVVETNPGAGTMVRMRIPKSQPFHETERAVSG